MNWSLDIPFKDRDDLVLDTITAAKEKFGEDDHRTRVTEVIATNALADGVTTVGALLDQLGRLSPTQARGFLDQARVKAGLETTGEVDRHNEDARFDRELDRLTPPPPPRWSPLQGCPAKGCRARPIKENGAWAEVQINQWWCPEHEHLAPPEDLKPYEPPYIGTNPNGRLVPSPKEKARLTAWHKERWEKEKRERRKREEHREREAEAIAEAKQRFADEGQISVMGIRTRPDLRRIQ